MHQDDTRSGHKAPKGEMWLEYNVLNVTNHNNIIILCNVNATLYVNDVW